MSDSEDFDAFGDDVYQPQGEDTTDDSGIFDEEDNLMNTGLDDLRDEGYSPPEKPRAVEHTGTTAEEEREGESLDERLTEEVPDVQVPPGDGLGDTLDTDGELIDDEVGDLRAGRLVAPDEGARPASRAVSWRGWTRGPHRTARPRRSWPSRRCCCGCAGTGRSSSAATP
ncbi:hypothetical protein ACFU6O_28075, partial [Streptomyces albidoflavus]